VLTAPVRTGVPPVADDRTSTASLAQPISRGAPVGDAPITLAGRLQLGDALPETTALALALENATRAMQRGRADLVLSELNAVWSPRLASDSPWYLRTAALQLLGRTSDAEQMMREAIALLPRSAAMLYLLAVHTANRGQPEAAQLANDHALLLHPNEPLLLLQRAALSHTHASTEFLASLLHQVATLAPHLPLTQWFTTLATLGSNRVRQPTPAASHALASLTPRSSGAFTADVRALLDAAKQPPPATALEGAVRYGLSLLDSPTHCARVATVGAERGAPDGSVYALRASSTVATPHIVAAEAWEIFCVTAGIAVFAFVPTLRLAAALALGVAVTVSIARRMR
jgi:hypothetical protein